MHGAGSTVTLRVCISIGQKESIAGELPARLGCLDGEKRVEAVFEGKPRRLQPRRADFSQWAGPIPVPIEGIIMQDPPQRTMPRERSTAVMMAYCE